MFRVVKITYFERFRESDANFILLSLLMSKTILAQTSLLLARQMGLGLKLAGRTPACILLFCPPHNNVLRCIKSCIARADIVALRGSTCAVEYSAKA